MAHRWTDRNLTKLELVVAILILTILIATFSRYVLVMFSRAEQSMVNSTIININTALYYRAALAVLRGEYQELKLLESINPLADMRSMPDIKERDKIADKISYEMLTGPSITLANYVGVINTDNPNLLEKGKWYFHEKEHYIVYVISNPEFFSSELDGLARLRFRIVMDYEDINANEQFDQAVDEFRTMKLHSIDEYQWNI